MIEIAFATAGLTLAFAAILVACYALLSPLSKTEGVHSFVAFCMALLLMGSFSLAALWMGTQDQERANFQANLDRMSRALAAPQPQAKPPAAIDRSI